MGKLTRLARLTFFVGLAGAAAVVEACGSSTKDKEPATGGTGASTGGGATGGNATGGVTTGGTSTGGASTGGVATGGTTSTGGQLISDAGVKDADDLWDVIYE